MRRLLAQDLHDVAIATATDRTIRLSVSRKLFNVWGAAMDIGYESYAVYWVPHRGSALAQFGVGWTGWCSDRGDAEDIPEIRRLSRGRSGVPGSVARRGLHAIVKSPFALSADENIWQLHEALEALAHETRMINLPRIELTVFDGQVVLALTNPCAAVVNLMRDVAKVIDPCLKVPVYAGSPQPGARDWGSLDMPVMERFHMPLTDHLELGIAYEVVADLRPVLEPILMEDQVLADLALVGDPGDGRPWRLIERYELSQEPAPVKVPIGMDCNGPQLIAPFAGVIGRGHDSLSA